MLYSIVKCDSVLVFIYINVETESACQLLPRLSTLARSTLCVTASSTSSERLFSQAGNIFTEKRTGLGPEKLDDILLVMWNRDSESASSIVL